MELVDDEKVTVGKESAKDGEWVNISIKKNTNTNYACSSYTVITRPFEILKRFGHVTYRLRLPEELSSVHNTFHMSNLKKCLANANLHVSLDEIKVDKTLHFFEEPVEIMDREVKYLKRRKIPIVKRYAYLMLRDYWIEGVRLPILCCLWDQIGTPTQMLCDTFMTPLCCDDTYDVTPRVSALARLRLGYLLLLNSYYSGITYLLKVAAPTQESDDRFAEVTRKHGKGKQNGKPQHIDGIRLTKPQPNYLYRVVSKSVNVNDEASTSQPKGNKEASLQPKSNINDNGNPMGDLVGETRKKVEVHYFDRDDIDFDDMSQVVSYLHRGIVAGEGIPYEPSPATFPRRQVAGERFPQRQVAGESPKMSLEKAVNVVVFRTVVSLKVVAF
nr:putative reverse transcriptase domain-containing protein [Tanacetum cinerariifolium]